MDKKVIIGEKYASKLQKSLENHGFKCVILPKHKTLDWQINSHADILAFVTKNHEIILEPSIKVDFEHIKGDTFLEKGYPNNIAYNAFYIGNKFFHNTKYTDNKILAHIGDAEIHNINQGFSKCSVLIIDENTAITSDDGIAKVMIENNINILKISSGQIQLDGYDYGFIGGCGFVFEKKLYLTGDISQHFDFEKIKNLLDEKNIEIINLTTEKIFDIGSFLLVN